ncbi:MAG TPA: hypothetical protein VMZ00_15510 [Sporichthya sp.]|nr:hypothetical protein [Sporichthya sp.]
MTDNSELKTMLDNLAGSPRPASDGDLAGDLTRGHSALRRRRVTLITNGALALAVIGGLTLAGTSGAFDGSDAKSPSVNAAPSVDLGGEATSAIQFVAYTGAQPEGFTVATVPDGWKIQGVTEYALLIVPPSGVDDSLDSFVGKLVVMLESQDAKGPFDGKEIAVGDRTGVISRPGDGYGQLHFTDANGNRLDVQWPDNKQWTDAEMADFAAGITVLDGAKAGRG